MKKFNSLSYLMRGFISGGIAALVVILSFGVSTVFGVYNPSEEPPGGLVHPNFSGITVGPSQNFEIVPGGAINSMAIKSDGITFFINNNVGETHDVVISNGSLQTRSVENIQDLEGYVDSTVTISSRKWGGTMLDPVPEASSSISLVPSSQGGAVSITAGTNSLSVKNDDGIVVDGSLSATDGELNVSGNLVVEGGSITANGANGVESFIQVYDDGTKAAVSMPFSINDNVEILGRVLGNLTVEGDIKFFEGPGPQPTISGSLKNVMGAPVTAVNINADEIVFDGEIKNPSTEDSPLNLEGEPFKISDDVHITGYLGVGTSPSYDLDVLGDARVDGTLIVNTKIKADAIGSYGTAYSSKVDVNSSGYGYANVSCSSLNPELYPGDYILIDCGTETYKSSSSSWKGYSTLSIRAITPDYENNSCKVRVRNMTSDTRAIQAIARCWDPEI